MIDEQYVWFVWSSLFLIPWAALYGFFPNQRKAMIWASIFTMPFGLTEPIFVPEYWSPPSLFDLALKTGFDIESLIFCFAIGGIGSVLYNAVSGQSLVQVDDAYKKLPLHKHHYWALAAPFIAFPVLYAFPWNPIYASFLAMLIGVYATIRCRPDLKAKIWKGGLLFLMLYWLYVEGLELMVPGFIEKVWNLDDLSGVMVINSPLEELVFAFMFGTYWAGVYEHFTWTKTEISSN
jgi:hypothetical protein